MPQTLRVALSDGVATLTLDRPERRNALDEGLLGALDDAFRRIAADPEVRAFVLTGAGRHFCAGLDLSVLGRAPPGEAAVLDRMRRIHALMRRVAFCPKPGVAAVRGHAAGGGASLALACDLVVMSESAQLSFLFVRRGLVVDMSGTFTLPRAVGLHRAKELALLGEVVDARRALEIGIATRAVADADLEAAASEIAARLAAGPTVAMGLTKRAINEAFGLSFDDVLQRESRDQAAALATRDLREAVAAFFEKREPRFTGE